MFIDIINPGKNPRRAPCIQKYSVQAWENHRNIIEGKNPRVQADIHATGHDEYAVIHDPTKKTAEPVPDNTAKAETKAKVKPEAKPKGRPPQNKNAK